MFGKRITTSLLRSPFYDMVGQHKMLLTYTTPQAKTQTMPVDYYQVAGRRLLVFVLREAHWWGALRNYDDDVTLFIRKEEYPARPQVIEDAKSVAQLMQLCFMSLPNEAGHYGIGLNAKGQPQLADIARVAGDWACLYIKLYRILKLENGQLVEVTPR